MPVHRQAVSRCALLKHRAGSRGIIRLRCFHFISYCDRKRPCNFLLLVLTMLVSDRRCKQVDNFANR